MRFRVFAASLAVSLMLCGVTLAQAEMIKAPVFLINDQGTGAQIGTIAFSDTPEGLLLALDVAGLTPGEHGIHIHEVGDCGSAAGPDGKMVPGLAAKGHYDPDKKAAHHGPAGEGHKGDLPALAVAADGKATVSLKAPRLKVAEVKGLSVIIHAGGDNYADTPALLGGGGARVACAVIK